jgi:hypothetical protein
MTPEFLLEFFSLTTIMHKKLFVFDRPCFTLNHYYYGCDNSLKILVIKVHMVQYTHIEPYEFECVHIQIIDILSHTVIF